MNEEQRKKIVEKLRSIYDVADTFRVDGRTSKDAEKIMHTSMEVLAIMAEGDQPCYPRVPAPQYFKPQIDNQVTVE